MNIQCNLAQQNDTMRSVLVTLWKKASKCKWWRHRESTDRTLLWVRNPRQLISAGERQTVTWNITSHHSCNG